MAEYGPVRKITPPKHFRLMHRETGAVLTIHGYILERALARLKVTEADVFWVELPRGPKEPLIIVTVGTWPGLSPQQVGVIYSREA